MRPADAQKFFKNDVWLVIIQPAFCCKFLSVAKFVLTFFKLRTQKEIFSFVFSGKFPRAMQLVVASPDVVASEPGRDGGFIAN